MKIKPKAIAGVGAIAFTATGWGLYGSKVNETPEKILSSEEAGLSSPIIVQPTPVEVSLGEEVNKIISDNKKFVYEINLRDSMIDYKNGLIENLNGELETKERHITSMAKSTINLINTNLTLRKQITELKKENKDWEEYAEDLEAELDEKN